MTPDLEKLRRFALAIGLVLITYSLAAVELDTGETIKPLGLPLKVNRPDLLGIGLVLASIYAAARFWYYGFKVAESPKAIRDRIRRVVPEDGDEYSCSTNEEMQELLSTVTRVFPGFEKGGMEPIPSGTSDDETWKVRFHLVPAANLTAALQDLDYTAPIWFNGLALLASLYRVIFVGY